MGGQTFGGAGNCRAAGHDNRGGASAGPGGRPEYCIKSFHPTRNGLLCGPCLRKCEHAGRIRAIGEMILEELR